ncbi:AAA family ATPase, partial [Hyphomonas sp.]|uniref:AAA family ATPase n=1 Tax=Hyphomonas sp. TaxID=87 RepID=UPI00391C1C72
MQITELRIAGFKSFVDPQTVPVEPGLTGIVGPNGCGKSNLLEALRWAMGANSARAMRGGEMDDLIFSGSSTRPSRETAEVTLVLDNSKRTAPPEFNGADVLEIERKLRRGAGSSYRINGRTVRGKDIQLLFADASTGANSPALVRQGQISELIGSKPQNRRRILEEAAGIAGLNTRRHEAELKLDGAEANLQRLAEVSAEVERQLASLKRQVTRARRYRRLSEEIHGLEALLAHLRWAEARQLAETARAELARCREDVERLSLEDAMAERARIEAGEGLAPLRETEMAAAARLGQARITLAKLDTERRIASDQEARLSAEAARIEEDLARERALEAEAAAALARAESALAELPASGDTSLASATTEAETALAEARTRLTAAESAADEAQSRLADLRARRRAAEEAASRQQRRQSQLTAEIERLRAEMTGLEDTAIQLLRVRQARNAEAEAEAALQEAERAVELAEADILRLRAAEAEAQIPFDAASHAVKALEAEIAGLERLLRRSDTATTAPPVVERIRTSEGYEKAVAAALGDDITASTDRQAALYWGGADVAPIPLPEGTEPLSAYAEAPGELAARLALCGLVSPEDGPRLMASLQPGQRLVSRDGHLWRWDGFTRTPEAPVSAAARLEQQARLDAARRDLAARQEELAATSDALEAARNARLTAEESLRHVRQLTGPAQRTLSDARAKAAEETQASERAALRREAGSGALARAEAELAAITETLSFAEPVAAEEEAALDAALAAARETVAAARFAETESRGRLSDLTRQQEQLAARRASLAEDITSWTARAGQSAARLAALEERRGDLAAAAMTARERPQALTEEIDGLSAELDQLETERKAAADALAVKEAAIREADAAARRAFAAAAQAREALAGWTVKLETSEARLAETTELARHSFQRTPEGLLAIAEAHLD